MVNCTEWLQGEPAEQQQQQQQSVPRPIWCPRAREGAPENSSVSKIKFAYLLSLFAFSLPRSLLPLGRFFLLLLLLLVLGDGSRSCVSVNQSSRRSRRGHNLVAQ